MGSRAGAASQTIALPSGGGALQGLAETFTLDLFTGTPYYSVPIAVPPGHNAFQLQLSLTYSSGNGNGPFGLGWQLSVLAVTRKTAKGVPLYDDAQDIFILPGSEDLVPATGTPPDPMQYQPRIESLFARIVYDHSVGTWTVQTRDGLSSVYGKALAAGADPPIAVNPRVRAKGFAWRLSETMDPFGSRLVDECDRDLGSDGLHRWDQLYLKRVRYVDYDDANGPVFLVVVTFTYEDQPNPFFDYRAGFESRTTRRCVSIAIITEDPNAPVRTYTLTYRPDDGPSKGVSRLATITARGFVDGGTSEELLPLAFDDAVFFPTQRHLCPVTGPGMPPGQLAIPSYD
jgi:hypothetical protein